MGKHGADDQGHVVVDDGPVDPDGDLVAQPPAGELGHPLGARCVPTVARAAGSHQAWLRTRGRESGLPMPGGEPR